MLRVVRQYLVEHNRQAFGKASEVRAVQLQEGRAAISQQVKLGTATAQTNSEIRREAAATVRGLIKLNVGGVKHTTSLATLTAVPDTYFTTLFYGDWTNLLTNDGEMFIDRQGKCFEHILQYLRAKRYDQAFQLPESLQRDELAALATEAEFYRFSSFQHFLHEALANRPPLFQHKFLYKESYNASWEEHEEQVRELVRQGWELRQTILSSSNGNDVGLTRLRLQEH